MHEIFLGGGQFHIPCGAQSRAVKTLSRKKLLDPYAGVRVAAALALCRLGQPDEAVPLLIREIDGPNYVAGMYAIRGLELSGVDTLAVRKAAAKAQENPYEFTRRIATWMTRNFNP